MDWGKLLIAANLGVNLYQAGQLADLQEHAANAELLRQYTEMARNEIFRFRQLAETVLTGADSEPIIAATAMRVLELRLSATGLTPAVFSEFSDKEYVAQVTKQIRDARIVLLSALDSTHRLQVEQVAQDVIRLPDYDYFIDHDTPIQQAKAAESIMTTYEGRNGCLVNLLMNFILLVAILFFIGFLQATVDNASAPPAMALLIGVLLLAGIYFIYRTISQWQNKAEYNAAKKLFSIVESQEIDMERYSQLRKEFRNVETAQRMHHEAQQRIRKLLGDAYASRITL